MLKTYLTIAWRNLYRQPAHTFLNLACLTAGIGAALFIILYIDFELNYDRFHAKSDQIYQVRTTALNLGERVRETDNDGSPRNLAPFIKADFPEVQQCVRIFQFFDDDQLNLKYEGKTIASDEIFAADPSIFDVFTIDLLKGEVTNALEGPNKIMLSESLAQRIFGDETALGKVVSTELVHSLPKKESNYQLMVTGVYKDFPRNSHLTLNALMSAETDPALEEWYFSHFNTLYYLLLAPQAKAVEVAANLTDIYKKHLNPVKEPVLTSATHELVPLKEVHFRESGGRTYIFIFGGVALLLLIIAMISYVNLTTAQANRRSMEIGIRKVMGSNRRQLIQQFLSESLVYTALSMGIAILLVWKFVGSMNTTLGLELEAARLWQPELLTGIIGLWLILGLLGGSYPAFFLSSFQPITVIKSKQAKGAPIRRILVAVQLAVVIFVLSCTGMIYEQLKFMQHKDLGFNHEQVLRIELSGKDWFKEYVTFRDQIQQFPEVAVAGSSDFIPGVGQMVRRPISTNGSEGLDPQFVFWGAFDYNYPEVIGMTLKEGRFFSKDFPTDIRNSVIVNEAFLRQFGIEEPAVGKTIKFGDDSNPNTETIVGVIRDFHHESLHSPLAGQLFTLGSSPNVFVKLNNYNDAVIDNIRKSWQAVIPDTPFEFAFMDETLQSNYIADQVRGRIFFFFSILTIIIAFLGLFGLASYLSKQRVKEMSIRKVLGAELWSLITLVTKEFVWLVLLAAIPALLLAWYFIQEWLHDFAFHTSINYWLLGLALLVALVGTMLTTGWHAFQVARRNPADSLKQE